jgi:hypothetical protein
MGWKSTIDIGRKEAMQLIFAKMVNITNSELGDVLETLGYGEDTQLPYFGHNFNVVDKEDPCDGCHQLGSEYCAQACGKDKI